jgi:uncharacterized RDD family membrane protein YckC
MSEQIQFETPENIQVSYRLAGPGTRFVAWFIDTLLLLIAMGMLLLVALCAGVSTGTALQRLDAVDSADDLLQLQFYVVGVWLLVWGLGSFFYFGLSELLSRGQTIGKRSMSLRVAKLNGFALDPISVLVRNIFRVLDQIPVLWIVPIVSARAQRLGDMVAGTIVVSDEYDAIDTLRTSLENRSVDVTRYRFTATMLKQLRERDVHTVERVLRRWHDLTEQRRAELTAKLVPSLAARMQCELPPDDDHQQFLLDLLAAEYRRQQRGLG